MIDRINNTFGLRLYIELINNDCEKSIFFSPLSIIAAICVAFEGARGRTADEIAKMLCLPNELRRHDFKSDLHPWQTEVFHRALGAFMDSYQRRADDSDIRSKKSEIEAMRARHKKLTSKINQLAYDIGANTGELYNEDEKLVCRLNAMLQEVDQYELSVANSLWGSQTYPFNKAYMDIISQYYGTDSIQYCNFSGGPDGERIKINGWVEKQTYGKIADILPPDSITGLTRLVVANAVYFRGEWADPFFESMTRNEPFTLTDGPTINVDMMQENSKADCKYAAFNADGSFFDTPITYDPDNPIGTEFYPPGEGFHALLIPYRGHEIAMLFLLPITPQGLGILEARLDHELIARCLSKLRMREVNVALPAFKHEASYSLNDFLSAMGMPSAFIPPGLRGGADFTGMIESTDRGDQLYISAAIHHAFLEVNEKGTEAASATVPNLDMLSPTELEASFTPEFRADHPFVYMIMDKKTSTILFMGRMMKPER